jgi:hypothetical protein
MGRAISDLSFEAWLDFVFDHPVPVTGTEWYWSDESDCWDGGHSRTVELLTQTFLQAETALRRFSDAQLNQGFGYLVSNSCSDIAFCLLDGRVEWSHRKACLEAIGDLFENCFAQRCSNHLAHFDEAGANPLNAVCYMWWDVIPIHGNPGEPSRLETDTTILRVLEHILRVESEACQESALHGLGHWHYYYPREVECIVDSFIGRNRQIRSQLRNYAYAARHGDVL